MIEYASKESDSLLHSAPDPMAKFMKKDRSETRSSLSDVSEAEQEKHFTRKLKQP